MEHFYQIALVALATFIIVLLFKVKYLKIEYKCLKQNRDDLMSSLFKTQSAIVEIQKQNLNVRREYQRLRYVKANNG